MRAAAKRIAWGALLGAGVHRWARRRHRRSLIVVTYHGVVARVARDFLYRNCVSVEEFRRQVKFLRRHYAPVGLHQVVAALGGRAPLPPSSVLVTFDDGFRNNYDRALPVLRELGVPAVVFVTTGMLDRPGTLPWVEELSARIVRGTGSRLELRDGDIAFDLALEDAGSRVRACDAVRRHLKRAGSAVRERWMEQIRRQCPLPDGAYEPERYAFLDWDQARALARSGVAVGSHTVNHLCLVGLSEDEMTREVEGSRRRIEEEIGAPCLGFAYPDGAPETISEAGWRRVERAGYAAAFTQIPGPNRTGSDRYRLRRYNVPGGGAGFLAFVATLCGLRGGAGGWRG